MIIKNAKIFIEAGGFLPGNIHIRKDRLHQLEFIENNSWTNHTSTKVEAGMKDKTGDIIDSTSEEIIDARGLFAIPGLTDIHFHGCVGYDFCDGNETAISTMAEYQAKNGITQICPATMTLKEETLATIMKTAAAYDNEEHPEGALLCGINMEGPYISVRKKGAQNERFIRKPDVFLFRRLQKLSGGKIKLVAIAPEEEGAMEFISELKDEVVVSLAHTTADYMTAMEAFQRGAGQVTHLYNAMPPFSHRAPGVIGAAFDTPGCFVELICDGVHIHPCVVRATLQMFGKDRVVLISDSMMATGMPDGEYELGGQAVRVAGKYASLISDGALAGSVTNLMECMRNCVLYMGIPLETAVRCAAVNPAKAIGIYDSYGSLIPGKYANLVLLDDMLQIKAVFLKGRRII